MKSRKEIKPGDKVRVEGYGSNATGYAVMFKRSTACPVVYVNENDLVLGSGLYSRCHMHRRNVVSVIRKKKKEKSVRVTRDQLRAENEKQAARIAELEAGLLRARDRIEGGIKSHYYLMGKEYLAADAINDDHDLIDIQKLLSPKDTQGISELQGNNQKQSH